MTWVAGWNQPGYLSDNPPEEFDTWKEASDYLHGELVGHIDHIEEVEGGFRATKTRQAGDALSGLEPDEEWTSLPTEGGYVYFIVRAP